MIEFSAEQLDEDRLFKLLLGSVVPRPLSLITTKNDNGTTNIAPFSFFNVASSSPPLVTLAIQRRGNKMKDTTYNLLQRNEAVIHIIDRQILEEAYSTNADFAYGKSENALANFELVTSKEVGVQAIKEASIRFEVKNYRHIKIEQNNDFFLLEVVRLYFNERVYDDGRVNFEELNTVGALIGNQFVELGERIVVKDENMEY